MLLILFLLVVAVTAVIACLAVYNHKRRQPTQPTVAEGSQPTAVGKTQPTVIEEAQPTTAEEPQSIVAEEAEPAPAEETQPTPVEETQAGGAPEGQPIVVQEAEPTAVAETKPAAVEEAQPIAAEELQPPGEETKSKILEAQPTAPERTKRKKPEERGGRPRGPVQIREQGSTSETKPRRSKPEIVCWKRERQWVPAVEVPEEFLENPGLTVFQNGFPLPQDESREGCWRLEQTLGEVVVHWNEGEGIQETKETKVALGQEGHLLFKLSGQNQNQGRHVKSPSFGSYLLIVPENWERDEASSGPPPVAPEPVSVAGYKAHFFDLEKDGGGKIVFNRPIDKPLKIEPKTSRFELVGTRLTDASEYVGPLFGGRPPQIRVLDDQEWKDVGTIVVGEEGSGRGRWRKQFNPVLGTAQQDLPSEVADRKGGWFFLRFYDTNDELIESLDFRFICALREIRIPQPSPLPFEDGHGLVRVMFFHEPGCAVQPADSFTNIQIEHRDDKTIVTIPPDPTYDETRWRVGPEGGPRVEMTILVERVWWTVGEENKAPFEWKDTRFTLPRDDFAPTSNKAIWVRLPRPRWTNSVSLDFERPNPRRFDVKVTENTVPVRLREFESCPEITDCTREHKLKVWLRDSECVVAVIPAIWKGDGKKKKTKAEVVLQKGQGKIRVNGELIHEYFILSKFPFLNHFLKLKDVSSVLFHVLDASIKVEGGIPRETNQSKAVVHALVDALIKYDPKLFHPLKHKGFCNPKKYK